jgi:hypothetical protein
VSLAWTEIGERWPDAVVMWDRDVAPTLDWEPVFRERDGVLWADCIRDHWHLMRESRRSLLLVQDILPADPRSPCRCRVWDPTLKQWWVHQKWNRIVRISRLNNDLHHGRLLIMGTPWPGSRAVFHDDDRIDSLRYAYRHLWSVHGPGDL